MKMLVQIAARNIGQLTYLLLPAEIPQVTAGIRVRHRPGRGRCTASCGGAWRGAEPSRGAGLAHPAGGVEARRNRFVSRRWAGSRCGGIGSSLAAGRGRGGTWRPQCHVRLTCASDAAQGPVSCPSATHCQELKEAPYGPSQGVTAGQGRTQRPRPRPGAARARAGRGIPATPQPARYVPLCLNFRLKNPGADHDRGQFRSYFDRFCPRS